MEEEEEGDGEKESRGDCAAKLSESSFDWSTTPRGDEKRREEGSFTPPPPLAPPPPPPPPLRPPPHLSLSVDREEWLVKAEGVLRLICSVL